MRPREWMSGRQRGVEPLTGGDLDHERKEAGLKVVPVRKTGARAEEAGLRSAYPKEGTRRQRRTGAVVGFEAIGIGEAGARGCGELRLLAETFQGWAPHGR